MMVTTLSEKYINMLHAMKNDQLIEIICELIKSNKQAKLTLVNGYLTSAQDLLKNAEKMYNKKIKDKTAYGYCNSADFFSEIYPATVCVLEKTVSALPAGSETLAVKMILDFAGLCENIPVSGTVWMKYYNNLVDIWLRSLANQREKGNEVIAQKIAKVYTREIYFGIEIFDHYKTLLGFDILRSFRDILYSKNITEDSLMISFYIKDTDFLKQALIKNELFHPRYFIDLASLLIDEICPDEAVKVLERADKKLIYQLDYEDEWNEAYCLALIEDGRAEEAKTNSIDSFKNKCNIAFYNIFLKVNQSGEPAKIFFDIAKEKGFEYYVSFLAELQHFDAIAKIILSCNKKSMKRLLEFCKPEKFRNLSGELYLYGYAKCATLLTRILVEDNIFHGKRKYYGYAATDMKKSIEYSKQLEGSKDLESTEDYLKSLYSEYKDKTSLWKIMQDKIAGLIISPGGIYYSATELEK